MASIFQMPDNTWDQIRWTPQQLQKMYLDWGNYYSHKMRPNKAKEYFEKSLAINPNDVNTLHNRINCERMLAKITQAYDDSKRAQSLTFNNIAIDFDHCISIYELNKFERAKRKCNDYEKMYGGYKSLPFKHLNEVLGMNFKDILGESYLHFAYENEKVFQKVHDIIEKEKYVDKRPLWKIIRDDNKCDVLSVLDKEVVYLSPLELARRDRCFKVFIQRYFRGNRVDIAFLRHVRHDKNLMMPQFKDSYPRLKELPNDAYASVMKFLRMLHRRNPIYNKLYYSRDKFFKQFRDKYLSYIQFQTRRNMVTILKSVHMMRNAKLIDRLAEYVDRIITNYVLLRTNRIMPWKFEFVNEVYNILGLAYADTYVTPPDIMKWPNRHRVRIMLKMPAEIRPNVPAFVFGDKSTYQEYGKLDPAQIRFRNVIADLEKRIPFTKYTIDKVYLWHEFARVHLNQANLEECRHYARLGIQEARNCNSRLWEFLCTMLMLKADAVLMKVERCDIILSKALILSKQLKDRILYDFVETCIICNNIELEMKKAAAKSKHSRSRSSIKIRNSEQSVGVFSQGSLGSEQQFE